MTEKRYKLHHNYNFGYGVEDNYNPERLYLDEFELLVDELNNLNDENEQLKQILNELSNRLQFDVENGIRSYPGKLSEYLSNALKGVAEMIEQFRYSYPFEKVYDCDTFNGETIESYETFECCEVLNQLNKENEKLKEQLSEQGIQIDFLEAENQHMRDLINKNKQLKEENQRLKAQLFADPEEGVCHICKHQYLIKHPQIQGCYIAKCKKAYEECSKESLNYCEDFEIKEDIE